jgi:hypothetical protein
MKFREINDEKELLCNLKPEFLGNGFRLSWVWPIGCTKIVIVLVPENENFDDSKIDLYEKRYVFAKDGKSYYFEKIDFSNAQRYKYHIYTTDSFDENTLIRQPEEVNSIISVNRQVTVKYNLIQPPNRGFLAFFLKKKKKTIKIKIQSNADLETSDICYHLFKENGTKTRRLYFPFEIKKNEMYVLSDIDLPNIQSITIVTNKDNVKVLHDTNI